MSKQILLLVMVFGVVLSPPAWSIDNPTAANRPTIDSGRMWPGTDRRGLIRNPSSVNLNGNEIVTGNVTGGRHFRDSVGYNSPWDFGEQTSSSTLNSFLRRSAGSANNNRYLGSSAPYYSQWTTYRKSPVSTGSVPMSSLKIDDRASGSYIPPSILRESNLYRYYGADRSVSALPLVDSPLLPAFDSWKTQATISSKASKYLMGGEELTDRQLRILQQQLESGSGGLQINDEAPDLKYEKFNDEKSLQSFMTKQLADTKKNETQTYQDLAEEPAGQQDEQWIIGAEQLSARTALPSVRDNTKTLWNPLPADTTEKTDKQSKYAKNEWEITPQLPSESKNLGMASARAKTITGQHRTFDEYLEDKSREHIEEANEKLKAGEYYRAADAYALALLYKKDAIAYAGKSHALFAAGEYMSSAYFLSLALQIKPEYAQQKIDIESMMTGRDIIETRLVDIEKWTQESDLGDLHFLRAYFYYRLGRIERAKEAIEMAMEKLPNAPAPTTLNKAINQATPNK